MLTKVLKPTALNKTVFSHQIFSIKKKYNINIYSICLSSIRYLYIHSNTYSVTLKWNVVLTVSDGFLIRNAPCFNLGGWSLWKHRQGGVCQSSHCDCILIHHISINEGLWVHLIHLDHPFKLLLKYN